MDLQEVYDKLSFTDDCLIRLSDKNWKKKVVLPSRVCRLLEENELLRTLDAFFCFDNKPLILFFKDPQDRKALHQAIWNFNESPIAIIVENNVVEIFNGFAIDENRQLLNKLGGNETLNDFSYFELVTGKTWEKYNDDINHKNRVDYRLLENIEAVQKLLKEKGLAQTTANALLGKIIFFRYLIDRHVRLNYQEKELWSNEDLCNCLSKRDEFIAFIRHIENKDTGFNGDMFRLSESEFNTIGQDALDVLIRLLRSEEILTGQQSLFDIYDFSILPIEFISNMYEKFIGKENQEDEGAYYTPTFLVDYIVSETIGKKLNESNDYNCKVLDPACGSGIFLVESLRKIIEKYIAINEITDTNTDDFRQALKNIAQNNIFGIDKDPSAIQVAIFSVYLTLLDYQKPADIGKFKFPNLIGTNFICSDTFNLDNKDLKALEDKRVHFDYIIGNPPWKRGGVKKNSCCEKYLKQKGYLDKVGNKELAQAFVFRTLDFTNSRTQCALILVSKVLYNLNSNKFRTFILDNLFINQVFELASVRKEVFNKSNDSAIAPACVLFYRSSNGELTDCNIMEHIALKPSRFFSLFKIFSLTRSDIQKIQQDRLKKYDWLWKVLVYGSYLDFVFIKRLKSYKTILETIKTDYYVKQGYKEKDGSKKIDTKELKGWNLIKNKNIEQYYSPNDFDEWDKNNVGYIYREKQIINTAIYKAPFLIMKDGVLPNLKSVTAICYTDAIYNDSITAIVSKNGNNSYSVLRNIMGLLNSSLAAYQNLLTFSSSGIEREHTHDREKLSLPYIQDLNLAVEKMEVVINEYHSSAMSDVYIEQQGLNLYEDINRLIYKKMNCSDLELCLIDYASSISIPMAIRPKGYEEVFSMIRQNDSLLKEYAQVYIDRFANSFNRNGKRFMVEILYSRQVIGMYFKVIDESMFIDEVVFTSDNENLLPIIIALTSEKLTDALFVQKDVRGFEKEYFYIFKPNEKRLWHKAVAHLDVNEFDDAMLSVGRNRE